MEDYTKPLKRYEKNFAREALIKILKSKQQIKRSTIRDFYPLGDYRLLRRLMEQGFLILFKDRVKSYYELTPEGIAEFNLTKYLPDV